MSDTATAVPTPNTAASPTFRKQQPPQPLLPTPPEQYNDNEKTKLASDGFRGALVAEAGDLTGDGGIGGEAEAIAKSHGIYLEYNRAKSGKEKDWMYMIRLSVPGGGTFSRDQWRVVDEVSDRYTVGPGGRPSIRLTTRQNIQYHWVKKPDLIPLVRDIARTGFWTLNGCGDNTRNVMACPLSRYSTLCDAHALAQKYGRYFELRPGPHVEIFAVDPEALRFDGTRGSDPVERFRYAPNLLNRKFKIAFSTAHRDPGTGETVYDNCVEMRTNDMGVAPVVEDGRVVAYQAYVGGGQGEKNGKPSFSTLSQPLGVFTPDNLHKGLDAIVKVHQAWGDRKNRHWARVKYVVQTMGIDWYREQVRAAGATCDDPVIDLDIGPRRMHHGWQKLESTGKWAYGLFVENGRLVDRDPDDPTDGGSGNGSTAGNAERLKSAVRQVLEKYDGVEAMITANQDLLFVNVDEAAKVDLEADLRSCGHGTRRGRPYSTLRLLSGACVGLPTCRLSYTDSEQFEPELVDELENMGYGDVAESVGVTGCERQCFRPGTKSVGWVGQGPDLYMLKIGGSEDGRHQGTPIVVDGQLYLRQVGRAMVPLVTAALFDNWRANRSNGEDLGAFHRRIGHAAVLEALRDDARTTGVTLKAHPATWQPA